MRDRFWAGLAFGLAVALGVSLVSSSGSRSPIGAAFGESGPSANNEFLALMGAGAVVGENTVVVIDTKAERLMVYDVKAATNQLTLVAVRQFAYDSKLDEFGGSQKPSVKELRDAWKQNNAPKPSPSPK